MGEATRATKQTPEGSEWPPALASLARKHIQVAWKAYCRREITAEDFALLVAIEMQLDHSRHD